MTLSFSTTLRLKHVAGMVALTLLAGSWVSAHAADECLFPMRLGSQILDYNSFCRMADAPMGPSAKSDDDDAPKGNPVPKGKRDGLERCYDPSGKMVEAEFHWRKGDLQKGWAVISTGQKMEFSAKGGTLHGTARVYSRKGDLACEIPFNHGEATGILRKFYPDGSLESAYLVERAKEADKGGVSFDKSGNLLGLSCASQSVHPKDAEWCGRNGKAATVEIPGPKGAVINLTHRDGKLVQMERTEKDGRRSVAAYPEPGNNKRFDLKEYFANGTLNRSLSKNDGRTVGAYALYAESGALLDQVRFNDDERPLEHKSYYLNGTLKSHAVRVENQNAPVAAESGVKKKRRWSDEGDLFTLKRYYDNGTLKHEGVYSKAHEGRNGDRPVWEFSRAHGKVRDYNEDGSLAFEGNYDNGRAEGLQLHIDDKGVKTEEFYRKGMLVSRKRFNAGGKLLLEEEYFEDGSRKKAIRHDEKAEKAGEPG